MTQGSPQRESPANRHPPPGVACRSDGPQESPEVQHRQLMRTQSGHLWGRGKPAPLPSALWASENQDHSPAGCVCGQLMGTGLPAPGEGWLP